jgi:hypothetical protein
MINAYLVTLDGDLIRIAMPHMEAVFLNRDGEAVEDQIKTRCDEMGVPVKDVGKISAYQYVVLTA